MLDSEETAMKKGMDCLYKNLSIIEIEMFISAIVKSAYDYSKWRQEYFENSYKDENSSQLENFLNTAANNDPRGVSFGIDE